MTLDELKIMVAEDLRVDDERLDTESLKNQELYTKYLGIINLGLNYSYTKQRVIIKYYSKINGNTMVVNQMQKYMQLNPLT